MLHFFFLSPPNNIYLLYDEIKIDENLLEDDNSLFKTNLCIYVQREEVDYKPFMNNAIEVANRFFFLFYGVKFSFTRTS